MVELGMDHLGPLLFFWRYAGVTIMAMRSCSSSGEEGLAMLAAMMEVHGSTLQRPISLLVTPLPMHTTPFGLDKWLAGHDSLRVSQIQ